MKSVIIYGPQASNKSTNSLRISRYFGLSIIVDEWGPGASPFIPDEHLYITQMREDEINLLTCGAAFTRKLHIDLALELCDQMGVHFDVGSERATACIFKQLQAHKEK